MKELLGRVRIRPPLTTTNCSATASSGALFAGPLRLLVIPSRPTSPTPYKWHLWVQSVVFWLLQLALGINWCMVSPDFLQLPRDGFWLLPFVDGLAVSCLIMQGKSFAWLHLMYTVFRFVRWSPYAYLSVLSLHDLLILVSVRDSLHLVKQYRNADSYKCFLYIVNGS
jgi:hypothetical protein